ncbi:hypothetical protein [Agromyces humi]|uniref:hypothetical protein n=1 Tax=Agromyces humi TaxID=1766800 RepID=UPI0013588647|nr:hypothetical protein [Agromyces humi]
MSNSLPTVNPKRTAPRDRRSGRFTFAELTEPEIQPLSDFDMEFEADWEARFAVEDLLNGQAIEDVDHERLLELARTDVLLVAAAAQQSPNITVNDLAHLIEERLLVPAGAFANPNFGRLPFAVQARLIEAAFPEERLIAAANQHLHPAVLAILDDDTSTGDDDTEAARAA